MAKHLLCTVASWSSWTEWSNCNCNGEIGRTRECFDYHQNGSQTPETGCYGSKLETILCTKNEISCHQASWSHWTKWSNCNCNGEIERTRECIHSHPNGSQTPATGCPGAKIETILCTKHETSCHPASWSSWTEWSNCNCNGEIERTRECFHYYSNGSQTLATGCPGAKIETILCTKHETSCHPVTNTAPPVSVMTTKIPDAVLDFSTSSSIVSINKTTPATVTTAPGSDSSEQSTTTPASHTMSTNHPGSQHSVLDFSTIDSMNTTTPATVTTAPGSDSSEQSTSTAATHTMSTSHPGSQQAVLDLSTMSSIVSMSTTTPATATIAPGSDSSEQSTTTPASHTMSTSHPGSQPQATAANTTPVTTNATQPQSISCFECSDDPTFCEYTYQPVTCSPPNNYCINELTNNADASKVILRRCGNYDECVHDWWQTYSDNELCKNFNQDTPYNEAFNCKFCCVKDGCNERINPPKEMNFVKN